MTTLALPRTSPWTNWLLLGVLGAACWVVLSAWQPPDDAAFSVCAFRRLTHVPCPGCGLTRSIACLAKGQVRASLAKHPLGPLVAAELAIGWLLRPLALSGRWSLRREWIDRVVLGTLALMVAVWIVRLATGTLGD